MLQPPEALGGDKNGDFDPDKDSKPQVPEWRYGPAQLWYDMLGVDETGEDFDYGFRLKQVWCFVFVFVYAYLFQFFLRWGGGGMSATYFICLDCQDPDGSERRIFLPPHVVLISYKVPKI